MEPQPLTFTTRGRGTTPSQTIPVEVDIRNWDQLGTRALDEVCLSGAIDLSTSGQVIDFNAWVGLSAYRLVRAGKPRDVPKGTLSVELTDECTVTITASLTCEIDFIDLAQAVLRLIEPMHT